MTFSAYLLLILQYFTKHFVEVLSFKCSLTIWFAKTIRDHCCFTIAHGLKKHLVSFDLMKLSALFGKTKGWSSCCFAPSSSY